LYSSIEKRRRKTIECSEGTIRAALLMPTTRLLYRHEELTQKLRGGTGERTQTTNNNKESIDERTRQVDGASGPSGGLSCYWKSE
jgi:hypothetical protein